MHPDKNLDPITLPLHDSRLIEASAGTGKTYTIAILYLRLVLGLRGEADIAEPLTPPQILVTTYTQAAVEELRDRIRARLSEMASAFAENRAPADKPLAALFARFTEPSEREHAAFLLQHAAEWMDEAAIYTIHGFCQRMLSEHAFHSRALFEQTLITDLEPFKEQAVRDFWRTHGYALNEQLPEAEVFAETFQSPTHFYKKINRLLQRDGRPVAIGDAVYTHSQSMPALSEMIAAITELKQSEQKAAADARQALLRDFDQLKQAWLEARTGLNRRSHPEAKTAEELQIWLAAFHAWANSPEMDIEDKQFAKLTAPTLKKNAPPPTRVDALSTIEEWQLLRAHNKAEIEKHQKQMWAFGVLWVRERIGEVLESQQKMTFEDLLTQMDQALSATNPNAAAMRQAIRRQYPVAMIDEFQDTDPKQLRIFDAIYDIARTTTDKNSAIILIGDPKQAIYGFRGADIN
ncbi:MAG TPA: exodeoxyribonuclease V subunit beta, partial [Halothiobacillaceae bacterium]|nr:exodeoxyribonuclease V subunit beta [Halothiobacillaceae bacterium]